MNDFIIDFETLATGEKAAVIDLALVTFNPDPTVIETFADLTSRGHRVKFDLASQKGKRVFNKGTIGWWRGQSDTAKLNLKPHPDDMSTIDGTISALEYLRTHGVDSWKSQGWCRGMSFDFPIFVDLIRDLQRVQQGTPENELDTFKLEPCKFWNQRDIRTAIECYAIQRDLTTTPLPKGVLDGFIAHDSIHDCAKDILMLKYAQRYALGLEEIPDEANTDPLSLPKGRS